MEPRTIGTGTEDKRKVKATMALKEYEINGEHWWGPEGDYDVSFAVLEQQNGAYKVDFLPELKNHYVVDCGAHIGTFTVDQLRKGAAGVIAVEPNPSVYEALRKNTERALEKPHDKTSWSSGECLSTQQACWSGETTMNLMVDPEFSGAGSLTKNTNVERTRPVHVQCTTVDDLVEASEFPRIDLIKMDIEGSELHALIGAIKTIQRWHPRLLIAIEHGPGDELLLSSLVRILYRGYSIKKLEWQASEKQKGSVIVCWTEKSTRGKL